jgi:glucose uptake protein
MILPHTDTSVFLIMVLSLVCLGSWASLYKLAGKWRYELFYFDFAVGVFLACMICAFTLGSLGFDGFTVFDDAMNSYKRAWMFGFVAACIFNLANMLLLGAMSMTGMTVAFPMAYGVAFVIGALRTDLSGTAIPVLVAGCVLIVASIVCNAMAYGRSNTVRHEAAARAGMASTRRPSPLKGIVLALVSGVLLGLFSPVLNRAQDPNTGLGPYAITMFFGLAVVVSTFVYNLFLINLPVEGEPLEILDYFHGSLKTHGTGFLAGIVFAAGLIAVLVCATPKGDIHPGSPAGGFLTFSVPLIAALWGLLAWKEFRGGGGRAQFLAVAALILFAGGISALSLAPLLSHKP